MIVVFQYVFRNAAAADPICSNLATHCSKFCSLKQETFLHIQALIGFLWYKVGGQSFPVWKAVQAQKESLRQLSIIPKPDQSFVPAGATSTGECVGENSSNKWRHGGGGGLVRQEGAGQTVEVFLSTRCVRGKGNDRSRLVMRSLCSLSLQTHRLPLLQKRRAQSVRGRVAAGSEGVGAQRGG